MQHDSLTRRAWPGVRPLSLSVAVLSLFLVQCTPSPDKKAEPAPAVAEKSPPSIVPPPPLTRSDLIAAVSAAASAHAAGAPRGGEDSLMGRRFSVRVAFGCWGPEPGTPTEVADGRARWWWRRDRESIELGLAPDDLTQEGLLPRAAAESEGPALESVEGFWLTRPWLMTEGCPAPQPQALGPLAARAPSPETVGLVSVFRTDDSRVRGRKGRAYSFVLKPSGDLPMALPTQGYRAVFEGRVTGFADGRAIRCRSTGPDVRPACVVAVQIDRVAFEDALGGAITEWRDG